MRDIVLTLVIFGALPWMVMRPYVGLLFWIWLSIMNPHRLAWGFAYEMPFAMIVAVATLLGMVVRFNTLYRPQWNAGVWAIIGFAIWVGVSPIFSLSGGGEMHYWLRVVKILTMVVIAFFLVRERKEIHLLAFVLTFSIAFFSIKGGVFTLASGGNYRVWGPMDSFVADNNSMACAALMAVPLIRYFQLQAQSTMAQWAYGAAILLSLASIIGSYSRGALVGMLAMGFFLWLKTRNKIITGAVAVAVGMLAFAFMPESWTDRMDTIGEYKEDSSAQGRFNAWWFAFNIAVSRILIGGGFNIYEPNLFARFAPNPDAVHAAHSIYFQVLGEHGFVGLAIFLFIFWYAWRCGGWVISNGRNRSDFKWAVDLCSMCQVSLVAYAAAGAFLSLSYYDFPYYVAVIMNVTRALVGRELAASDIDAAVPESEIRREAVPVEMQARTATARSNFREAEI